jgi:hypothetical protein
MTGGREDGLLDDQRPTIRERNFASGSSRHPVLLSSRPPAALRAAAPLFRATPWRVISHSGRSSLQQNAQFALLDRYFYMREPA